MLTVLGHAISLTLSQHVITGHLFNFCNKKSTHIPSRVRRDPFSKTHNAHTRLFKIELFFYSFSFVNLSHSFSFLIYQFHSYQV